jgi:protein-disulfide isomerase
MNPNSETQIEESIPGEASEEKAKPHVLTNEDVVTFSRVTMNYVVIAVVFFVVGIVVGAISFGRTATATLDREVIQDAVSEVLIDAGILKPPADMAVLVDDDPYLGSADAPVVIVEFSAYACPYCGRHFNQTLSPLLENYGQYVRYVFRDFPTINPAISVPAALAANCALEQGSFWEYHTKLFENQQLLGAGYFVQAANDLGLNMDQFNNCLETEQYMNEINDDFNAGVAAGVNGTPAFLINGVFVSGARPYEDFEAIIQRELDKAGIQY